MKDVNILLVDDDEINRLVATTFLRKWNINVTIATNGKEALDLLQSKKYTMVMMDLHMPEMDGYECTNRIRSIQEPYFQELPIIVFSASYTIDSKRKAAEHGMTDFMNKPFRHEELQEKIAMYSKGGQQQASPSTGGRPLKIDFKLHTDGDPVFKTELVQLLMENVLELTQSADAAISTNDPQLFLKACHKVYTAIVMLNDDELTSTVDRLREAMRGTIDPKSPQLAADAKLLNALSMGVVKSLEAELESMRKNPSLRK